MNATVITPTPRLVTPVTAIPQPWGVAFRDRCNQRRQALRQRRASYYITFGP